MGWWEKLLLPFTLPFSVCGAAKREARCLVSVNWCGQRETKPGSGVCSAMWLMVCSGLFFVFARPSKVFEHQAPFWGTQASLCRTGFGFPASQNRLLTLDLSCCGKASGRELQDQAQGWLVGHHQRAEGWGEGTRWAREKGHVDQCHLYLQNGVTRVNYASDLLLETSQAVPTCPLDSSFNLSNFSHSSYTIKFAQWGSLYSTSVKLSKGGQLGSDKTRSCVMWKKWMWWCMKCNLCSNTSETPVGNSAVVALIDTASGAVPLLVLATLGRSLF